MAKRRKIAFFGVSGLVLVSLAALGVIIGWRIADHRFYAINHKYALLDSSVNDPSIHQEIVNFDPLRQSLKQYFASLGMSHSFYFEYLPNGVNIRDGADTSSTAASLMKVPVIMDMYKLAESGKLNLDEPVTVQAKDISTDQDYGDPTRLNPGDTTTLRRAAKTTLVYSDNTTLNIIKDAVAPKVDNSTDSIQSLDVTYDLSGTTLGNEQVSISSRSYSSILKCLYYACFNTPQDSTEMLKSLIGSAEQNRIMAGVAAGIPVAHKVGSSPTSQSDCGIVYYPGKPYLICLMFLNLTPQNVTSVDPYFQKVSQMVYNYVATSGNQ